MAAAIYATPTSALFLKEREPSCFQDLIRWTYTTNLSPATPRFFLIAQKVLKMAVVILVALVLTCSILGIPLVLHGYKEYVIQREEHIFRTQIAQLKESSEQNKRSHFLEGRLLPLTMIPIEVTQNTIDSMASRLRFQSQEELNSPEAPVRMNARQRLFQQAALKYEHFLPFFGLEIAPTAPPTRRTRKIAPCQVEVPSHSLPQREQAPAGKIDRLITWIDAARTRGLLYKTCVHFAVIAVSIVLCLTILGIPLFLSFFDKLMAKPEQLFYDSAYRLHLENAHEEARACWKDGRVAPLHHAARVRLTPAIRQRIWQDHPTIRPDLRRDDRELLQIAALQHTDYLQRYGLTISSIL